jgi:hypothetical protein
MIKNCDEVLARLKEVYNAIEYGCEVIVDQEAIRKTLVKAGVKFNTQTGEAI